MYKDKMGKDGIYNATLVKSFVNNNDLSPSFIMCKGEVTISKDGHVKGVMHNIIKDSQITGNSDTNSINIDGNIKTGFFADSYESRAFFEHYYLDLLNDGYLVERDYGGGHDIWFVSDRGSLPKVVPEIKSYFIDDTYFVLDEIFV